MDVVSEGDGRVAELVDAVHRLEAAGHADLDNVRSECADVGDDVHVTAALAWGDDWRDKIDTKLASIVWFVPIVTLRYFRSVECRRELQLFSRHAEALGVGELVLPVVYVDVPELHEAEPSDEAVVLVRSFQWVDWRELRFEDPNSGRYRRAVAQLAQRLMEVNQRLSSRPVENVADADWRLEERQSDDEPGTLDLMAAAEEAIPLWTENVQDVGSLIDQIGELAQRAGQEMERAEQNGKGYVGRLVSARKFATDLTPLADSVMELTSQYTAHLYDVDAGIRTIIAAAPAEAAENDDAKAQVCELFETLLSLSESAASGMSGLEAMIESITPLEGISRDLRPPLRTLRQGLTVMVEGRGVSDEWARLIRDSGVDCRGATQARGSSASAE